MLSVLLEGTLTATPEPRLSAKNQPYTIGRMRAAGQDGESILCSLIAFSATAAEALAGLVSGDTVAVAGAASLNRWEKGGEMHCGLNVTVTRVMTVYEAGSRRKAASASPRAVEAVAPSEAS